MGLLNAHNVCALGFDERYLKFSKCEITIVRPWYVVDTSKVVARKKAAR